MSFHKAHVKQMKQWLGFSAVVVMLVAGAAGMVAFWPAPALESTNLAVMPADVRKAYGGAMKEVKDFEQRQRNEHMQVVSDSTINGQLSLVQIDTSTGQFGAARQDLAALHKALSNWNYELSGKGMQGPATLASDAGKPGMYLPILMYHYPPPNFDAQLTHLEQAGYTTIDLDEALAGLHGGSLPAKPVVITFDDGFAAQWTAYQDLLRHHMKATFYIIDAGEQSRWCIGAGRRYNDPLQPPNGCGDAYLTWDQVRAIDRSGLITIGGHTVNHRNLATLSVEDQRFEIQTGKQLLEQQLGHAVHHFAYPYGAFNEESIVIARQAGYSTAVTTIMGDMQPAGSDFTLHRVRDAMELH